MILRNGKFSGKILRKIFYGKLSTSHHYSLVEIYPQFKDVFCRHHQENYPFPLDLLPRGLPSKIISSSSLACSFLGHRLSWTSWQQDFYSMGLSTPRPTPSLGDQVTPVHRMTQLYPQALGTHFSRLLRHAWAMLGQFLSSGHYIETKILYAFIFSRIINYFLCLLMGLICLYVCGFWFTD
jgi:hypothetical protein